MRPAFSVILLTVLSGTGQGLFVALLGLQLFGPGAGDSALPFVGGGLLAAALVGLGLLASFWHLGRPERAWRAVAQWRTSWLSREVIVLPAFLGALLLWTWLHGWQGGRYALPVGLAALALCAALWLCTGMIYACLKFLQEWAHPLTPLNFTLLGLAGGGTLAAAWAALCTPSTVARGMALAALGFTLAAAAGRAAALRRNAGLKPRSTVQSAIGVRHPRIAQLARGSTGPTFNTREFFHGRSEAAVVRIRQGWLVGAFVLPALLLAGALAGGGHPAVWLWLAVLVQLPALVAERWSFFAEARHPQNLYYQRAS